MVKPTSKNSACKTILRPSRTINPQRKQMTTPPSEEKRKLIQQQLVLLLHANTCRKKDEIAPQREECQLPHCRGMKTILRHMVNCNIGPSCQFVHCSSSKQIIQHFKNCTNLACPICEPIKGPNFNNYSQTTLPTNQPQITSPGSTPAIDISEASASQIDIIQKRKSIQQHLVLLLHANVCQKKDEITPQREECLLPHCRGMKTILRHMINCNIGPSCQFVLCSSSKRIIQHFKNCTNSACSVCSPIKRLGFQNNTAQTTFSTNLSQVIAPGPTSELDISEASTSQIKISPAQQIHPTNDGLFNHNAGVPVSPLSTDNSTIGETLHIVNQPDVEMSPITAYPVVTPGPSSVLDISEASTSQIQMTSVQQIDLRTDERLNHAASMPVSPLSTDNSLEGGTLYFANQPDIEMSSIAVHSSTNSAATPGPSSVLDISEASTSQIQMTSVQQIDLRTDERLNHAASMPVSPLSTDNSLEGGTLYFANQPDIEMSSIAVHSSTNSAATPGPSTELDVPEACTFQIQITPAQQIDPTNAELLNHNPSVPVSPLSTNNSTTGETLQSADQPNVEMSPITAYPNTNFVIMPGPSSVLDISESSTSHIQITPVQQIDQSTDQLLNHNASVPVSPLSTDNSTTGEALHSENQPDVEVSPIAVHSVTNFVVTPGPSTELDISEPSTSQIQITPVQQIDQSTDQLSNHNASMSVSPPSTDNSTAREALQSENQSDVEISPIAVHSITNFVVTPGPSTELDMSETSTSRIQITPVQQIDQTADELSNHDASVSISSLLIDNSTPGETLDPTTQPDIEMSLIAVHSNTNPNVPENSLLEVPQQQYHNVQPEVEVAQQQAFNEPGSGALGPHLNENIEQSVLPNVINTEPANVQPDVVVPQHHTVNEPDSGALIPVLNENVEQSGLPNVINPIPTNVLPDVDVPQQQASNEPDYRALEPQLNGNNEHLVLPAVINPTPTTAQSSVEVTQQRTLNEPDSRASGSQANRNIERTVLPNTITTSPTYVQPNVTEDWRQMISIQQREKLILTMLKSTVLHSIRAGYQRRKGNTQFLKVLETEERKIYETANSFAEYSGKFVERCTEVWRELFEEQRSRQRQQRSQKSQNLQPGVEPIQQPQTLQPNIEPIQQQPPLNETDVEMPEQNQPNDPVVQATTSNLNVPDPFANPTPGPSGLCNNVPPVNDTLMNEQQIASKEWHNDFSSEFREILINECVRKILAIYNSEEPINNLEELQTTIDADLKSYVQKAENDIYQISDSRMEYYDLLADECFKIQCELRKRNFAALQT